MGRVVWTVGWFLPAVPHPMVVWEVVVNTDCGMWSHRDGFPGVVWSGLVWWCLGGTVGWFRLRWAHGSGCLDRGVVPPGRTTPRGRVGGRGQHRLWDVVTPGRIPRRGLVWSGLVWWCLGGTVGWFRLRWAHGSGCLDRGVVPPGRTTPRGRVGGRGQHRLWDVVTPGRIPRRGLVWSGLVVSGWDGGVVPVAVGSWVGLFGPWGGSSRPYHTPWSCGTVVLPIHDVNSLPQTGPQQLLVRRSSIRANSE